MKTTLALLLTAGLLAGPGIPEVVAHTADWPAKRLEALYPGADSYKKVQKAMTAAVRERVRRAVGDQFNKWDEAPAFYVPIGAKPDGKKGSLALIYIFDGIGEGGSIEMGVTVSLKGQVIRVVLFENKEPRGVNDRGFLDQFEGMTVGEDSYRSVEELAAAPGAGVGRFVVGQDVAAPEGAEASAQAVAVAVKKALLMMKELF